MKGVFILFTVVCQLLVGTPCGAQASITANWKLVKQEKGISVYTANAGATNRKYIKVVAECKGTLEKVKTVFLNVALQKNWVYGTKQSYIIQKQNNNAVLYYNETTLPWPVSNRDVVIQMNVIEDQNKRQLVIRQEGKPEAKPIQKGIVRVPHFSSSWQFDTVGDGKLQTTYYLDIDPGGAIPLWIVNMFVVKGPYETFTKLRLLLQQ